MTVDFLSAGFIHYLRAAMGREVRLVGALVPKSIIFHPFSNSSIKCQAQIVRVLTAMFICITFPGLCLVDETQALVSR